MLYFNKERGKRFHLKEAYQTRSVSPARQREGALGWGGGTPIHYPSPFENVAAFWLVCMADTNRRGRGGISRCETRA